MKLAASIVIWLVAAFCCYGALVHVLNMLSLTGFDWQSAPLKWQVLDVPTEFAVSEEQRGYLNSLVAFHCVTLVLVSAALWYCR